MPRCGMEVKTLGLAVCLRYIKAGNQRRMMEKSSTLKIFQMAVNLYRGTCLQRGKFLVNLVHTTNVQLKSESGSPGEQRIEKLLKSKLDVNDIMVRDISGGCGSMYEIFIASKDFKNKRTVQQHRLVNEILKDEVKEMHGLRIFTKVPE